MTTLRIRCLGPDGKRVKSTSLRFKQLSLTKHFSDSTKDSKNWYFLLPHVQLQKEDGSGYFSKPVAIELSHGTVIDWDGRLIRHCTSITKPELGGAAYITFACANEKANSSFETIKCNAYVTPT
jgi:hypothetical protein